MNKTRSFFQSFLPFILFIAIQVIVTIVTIVVYAVRSVAEGNGSQILTLLEELPSSSSYIQLVNLIFSIIILVIFGIWYHRAFVRPLGKRQRKYWSGFSFQVIVALIFLVFGLQYVAHLLTEGIGILSPTLMDNYNQLLSDVGFESMSLLLIVYSIILAPIIEEITFRGLTMRFARQWMPFWGANILQALLFGVMHMNVVQGAYAFLMGLFFGWVAKISHSIKQPILMHILFNFLGTICIGFFDLTLGFNACLFYGIGIALTIFAILILRWEFSEKNLRYRKTYKKEADTEES